MDSPFDFLKQAKPASLYKLLGRLSLADAAAALAGLPPRLSVQVMAYFSESRQEELLPILREARKDGPERAAVVASRIREILAAAKNDSGAGSGGAAGAPEPPARPVFPPRANSPAPPAKAAGTAVSPHPSIPPRRAEPPRFSKPTPWIPRAADSSPINGPALPGKPPPVEGDPLRSPLARAGLLDLIGRAQEKLLPKGTPPAAPLPSRGRPVPVALKNRAASGGKRPAAAEGRLASGKVAMGRTPRIVGPKGKEAKTDGGARKMDGKAILAAILRESGSGVRSHVREGEPALFRELRNRMFYFDDLIFTDDAALARVFTAAPAAEAALALRFAAPALRERALRAVSPGRAEALRDARPGRAGVDAIEAAQKKVLEVALQLQAAGRILIDPRDPDLAGT